MILMLCDINGFPLSQLVRMILCSGVYNFLSDQCEVQLEEVVMFTGFDKLPRI